MLFKYRHTMVSKQYRVAEPALTGAWQILIAWVTLVNLYQLSSLPLLCLQKYQPNGTVIKIK